MSVIKDLKMDFSSIAWCPAKEHASVMAMATMKNVTPLESEFPKSLSLYDWNLENVEESKKVAEARLPSGICSLNWSRMTVSEQPNAQGVISLGMSDGSVEFWIPSFSAENGWTLEKVSVYGVDKRQFSSVSVSSSAVQSMCSNCHNEGKQMCVGCNDGSVFLLELNDLRNPEVVALTKPGMNSEITQYAFCRLSTVVFPGTRR